VITVSGMSDTRAEILWYLMVELALFTFAALVHGGVIPGVETYPRVAMIETVVAVVLAAGVITSFVSPAQTRAVALFTQAVALLGVVVGVVTIVTGLGPQTVGNIVVYAVMFITVALGFAVAKRGVEA
jgi:hypothetical protein